MLVSKIHKIFFIIWIFVEKIKVDVNIQLLVLKIAEV